MNDKLYKKVILYTPCYFCHPKNTLNFGILHIPLFPLKIAPTGALLGKHLINLKS